MGFWVAMTKNNFDKAYVVRPIVTLAFVAALITAALLGESEAVTVLTAPASLVTGYWFAERKHT